MFLRKQEDADQLQILSAKLKELEDEVSHLKTLIKNNSHHQGYKERSQTKEGFAKVVGTMLSGSTKGLSETQIANKIMQSFSNSQKSQIPNSFGKFF